MFMLSILITCFLYTCVWAPRFHDSAASCLSASIQTTRNTCASSAPRAIRWSASWAVDVEAGSLRRGMYNKSFAFPELIVPYGREIQRHGTAVRRPPSFLTCRCGRQTRQMPHDVQIILPACKGYTALLSRDLSESEL